MLGVGLGAMYAAMAVGLVVTYRGSGIVNLAYATMAAYPALAYFSLVSQGRLVLPLIVVPADFKVATTVAPLPAFLIAVGLGVLLGVLAQLVVFRPIRQASALTRLVASIGLTVVVQAILVYRFQTIARRPRAILPDGTIQLFGKTVPYDRLIFAGIMLVLTAVIWVLLVRTRFGLATRAGAESEKGVVLLGYSPDTLGLLNAALAALVGSISGILLSPIAGVSPFSYSFFVVPALAAALAGQLKYLAPTFAVGLGLGMFQAMLVRLKDYDFMPDSMKSGFDEGIPFLLIVVVLAALGKRLPDRSALIESRRISAPPLKSVVRPLVGGVVVVAAILTFGDRTLRLPMIVSLIAFVLMLSQVVLTGYLGQISLAQLSFSGTAGFVLAKLSTGLGWPVPWAPLVAIIVPTVAGLLVSIPALRIRGVQLALVTLAFAIATEQLVFRNKWFTGQSAVANIKPPELFGVNLGVMGVDQFPQRKFGFIVLGVTAIVTVLIANLRRSGTGRRFLAVRANERAAESAGIRVSDIKLTGAGVSSLLASLSGVMLAYSQESISSTGYESRFAMSMLALGFLGGIGRMGGAAIAAVLVSSGIGMKLFELMTGVPSPELQLFLAGFGLLIVVTWLPDGLAGGLARIVERVRTVGAPPEPAATSTVEIELELEPVVADQRW